MRKPDTIEHLYLDFDGFFASVEQMRDPALRGRPVGIVPYEGRLDGNHRLDPSGLAIRIKRAIR